jgi:hypothetical protein
MASMHEVSKYLITAILYDFDVNILFVFMSPQINNLDDCESIEYSII